MSLRLVYFEPECVRDSSTNVSCRRENAEWDNQYVWSEPQRSVAHTHTHINRLLHHHRNTLATGMTSDLLMFVGVTFGPLPVLPPIKHQQSQPLTGVCWLPAWRDFTVSPGETTPHQHHWSTQTAQSKEQELWPPLRNQWRLCPLSRGNVLVSLFLQQLHFSLYK